MKGSKCFLFDLNGTMIDDMEFHLLAWSEILNNDLKANLNRQQVRSQMYGKNSEVLERIFGKDYLSDERMEELSVKKEKSYQQAYRSHLHLIAGLNDFMEKAKQQHIKMAIGSAAIKFNIDFVLDNLKIRHYFDAIVSADDVHHSKPDPETYLKCASLLNCRAEDCIVFEDAPKGVEAAGNAGMNAVVLTTMQEKYEFASYSNIICFVKDYNDGQLQNLFM